MDHAGGTTARTGLGLDNATNDAIDRPAPTGLGRSGHDEHDDHC